jgi:hypothetical protein
MPVNGGSWGWRTLGMADPGDGGPWGWRTWGWRTLGMADPGDASVVQIGRLVRSVDVMKKMLKGKEYTEAAISS